jgi:hypothetical protein
MTAHELAKKLLKMPDVEVVLDLHSTDNDILGVYEAIGYDDKPVIRIFSHE